MLMVATVAPYWPGGVAALVAVISWASCPTALWLHQDSVAGEPIWALTALAAPVVETAPRTTAMDITHLVMIPAVVALPAVWVLVVAGKQLCTSLCASLISAVVVMVTPAMVVATASARHVVVATEPAMAVATVRLPDAAEAVASPAAMAATAAWQWYRRPKVVATTAARAVAMVDVAAFLQVSAVAKLLLARAAVMVVAKPVVAAAVAAAN